ncbi:hypothetical protein AB5V95_02180 [Metamycoplasma spumans]|uniref:hypothetical protein n=1 Tax=Metamycoplasma spumans TaxID=92406 RepID=UPI0034DDC2EA
MKKVIKKLNYLLSYYISVASLGFLFIIASMVVFMKRSEIKLTDVAYSMTVLSLITAGLALFFVFIRLSFFNITLKKVMKQLSEYLTDSKLSVDEINILQAKKVIEYNDIRLKSSCLFYKKYLKNSVVEWSDEQY